MLDCHEWSASPIYKIKAIILVVRPGGIIPPRMDLLKEAEGKVVMPEGAVEVKWVKDKTHINSRPKHEDYN